MNEFLKNILKGALGLLKTSLKLSQVISLGRAQMEDEAISGGLFTDITTMMYRGIRNAMEPATSSSHMANLPRNDALSPRLAASLKVSCSVLGRTVLMVI